VGERPSDTSDLAQDVGFARREGSVMWVAGGDDLSRSGPPGIAVLSTSGGRNSRNFDTIRAVDGARLPVLAVTRCSPDLTANLTVRMGPSPDGTMTTFANTPMQTKTGQVTTMFSSVDLPGIGSNTFGNYTIQLTDREGCVVSSVQEKFVVVPVPTGFVLSLTRLPQ
jgi:hypothetical protein